MEDRFSRRQRRWDACNITAVSRRRLPRRRRAKEGGVATPFICSPPVKLGHRVTRARENGRRWVGLTHFWGPLRRRVRVHSEGPIVRLPRWPRTPFLPSFLPRGALPRYSAHTFAHSPNCRIDHSRSPRGRPARSSRGSGTADRLTRRPVVRLHMTAPQALPSVGLFVRTILRFTSPRAGGSYHPLLVARPAPTTWPPSDDAPSAARHPFGVRRR